jgi:hypothetical protein
MGRYIKNFETDTNAYAVRLPMGSSLIAPDHPVDGQLRFNKVTFHVEYYANSNWHIFAKSGNVAIEKNQFSPDGTSTNYGPMSKQYLPGEEANMIVFVGGVFQNPGVAYQILNGDFLQFTSPPPVNDLIVVLHNFNSTDTD